MLEPRTTRSFPLDVLATRRGPRRDRPSNRAAAAMLLGLLLAGCGAMPGQAAQECADDETTPTRAGTDQLVLTPARVSPGDRFKATFPEAGERDGLLWLAVRTEQGCTRTFYSADSHPTPTWEEVTDRERFSLFSFAVRGRVVSGIVPPVAPPGTYEVCGDEGGARVCGRLVVTDST